MVRILLRLTFIAVFIIAVIVSNVAYAGESFQYSGYLESDSVRSASMSLSISGENVSGTLSLRPVCQSGARLPGAEFNLTGTVSGSWEGKGFISGTWTGAVKWCERDEERSGSFTITSGTTTSGQGSVYFSSSGSYYNRYVFAALGRVSDSSASSSSGPASSWSRPTAVPGAPSYSSLGPPRDGLQGGIPSNLRQSLIGTVRMSLNETRLFSIPLGGSWFRTEDMKRIESFSNCYEAAYYTEPGSVLSSLGKVGDGMNVRAAGEGVGRVYASKGGCTCAFAGGEQSNCTVAGVWIVVVGEKGAEEYTGEKKKTGPDPGPEPDIKKAAVRGRVVMVATKRPVGNARISLLSSQGGAYYRDNWISSSDGVFSIRADNMLLSGVYEVMAQWQSRDMGTAEDPFTVYKDLWPIKKYFITISQQNAKKGVIDVGDIEMDTVDNIFNSGKGRDSSEFRDPVKKTEKTKPAKNKVKDAKQTSGGYNPFDDPNLKGQAAGSPASDIPGVDKLGEEFQSGQNRPKEPGRTSKQPPVIQPGSYTGRGEKEESAAQYPPYSSGYTPYGNGTLPCDDYQRNSAYDAGLRCGRTSGSNHRKMTRECVSLMNTYRNMERGQGWGSCLSSAFDGGYRAGLSAPAAGSGETAAPQKYTAELLNRAGDNVHIFAEGQENFGVQNRLSPGQRRTVNVNVSPGGGPVSFVAGRNGSILSRCSWNFSPTPSGSAALVTFSVSGGLTCAAK